MTAAKLEQLSGSTLDTVTIDWRNGIALVAFLGVKNHGASSLRATGVTRVDLARTDGAAKIVQAVKLEGDTATIVMQSGEELSIVAGAFSVDTLAS